MDGTSTGLSRAAGREKEVGGEKKAGEGCWRHVCESRRRQTREGRSSQAYAQSRYHQTSWTIHADPAAAR
jgi:hypothetical protein